MWITYEGYKYNIDTAYRVKEYEQGTTLEVRFPGTSLFIDNDMQLILGILEYISSKHKSFA